jgi:phage shock protein PspC (stress-responsive transcriptional regulator)
MIWYDRVALRVRTDEMKQTLAAAEKIWKKAYPTSFYKPEFLDDKIAGYYKADGLIMKLIEIFTGIAVFIGCLSLYGLVSFIAAQRKKEVAVRKVLGASFESLLMLFGKEFGLLLVIAFVLISLCLPPIS